jgi:peptide/nickel transport system permease protein
LVLRFVLQRVLVALGVVVGAASVTWLVFRVLRPDIVGDPRPIPVGLADFLWDLAHLDLGRAPGLGNQTVTSVLLETLPADLWLLGGAMVLGVVAGLAGGAVCGLNPRGRVSRALEAVSLLALCAPVYWVGLVSILLFSDDIGKLPIPVFGGQGTYAPLTEDPVAWLHGLLLPWIVLALPIAAACLRMLRLSVQDVLDEDFTRTALSKGLRWRRVVRRHVVPVGAPPVLSLAGALSATLVSNAILIEQTFNIPGTLRLMTGAIGVSEGDSLELAVLQGVVIAGAVVVVLCVLASEILHGWLDPRIRR